MNRSQTFIMLVIIVACALLLTHPPTMKIPYDDHDGTMTVTMTRISIDYAMLWTGMGFLWAVGIVGCLMMRGVNASPLTVSEKHERW